MSSSEEEGLCRNGYLEEKKRDEKRRRHEKRKQKLLKKVFVKKKKTQESTLSVADKKNLNPADKNKAIQNTESSNEQQEPTTEQAVGEEDFIYLNHQQKALDKLKITSASVPSAGVMPSSKQKQTHQQQQVQHQQQAHQQQQHQQQQSAVAMAAAAATAATQVGAAATNATGAQAAAVADTENPDWTFDPNEPRYCICNNVSYGDMVACDNSDCPFEWFHYPFVNITSPPC